MLLSVFVIKSSYIMIFLGSSVVIYGLTLERTGLTSMKIEVRKKIKSK